MEDISSNTVKSAVELTAFKNLCFSSAGTENLKKHGKRFGSIENCAWGVIGDRM